MTRSLIFSWLQCFPNSFILLCHQIIPNSVVLELQNYETQCSVVEPSRMPLPPMSGSQSAVDDSFKGSWEMVIEQSIDYFGDKRYWIPTQDLRVVDVLRILVQLQREIAHSRQLRSQSSGYWTTCTFLFLALAAAYVYFAVVMQGSCCGERLQKNY